VSAAYARYYQQLTAQTKLLAFMDCFHIIGMVTLLAVPLVLLTKNFKASGGGGGGH
jgi:DHA2 family multidrug resistance protein